MTANHKQYMFREIIELEELEMFMKLRYSSYFNSPLRNFLRINDNKIDLDIYDLHSKHFGLFCDGAPAGFVRIAFQKDEIYNECVYSIGQKYNIFNNENHSQRGILNFEYPDFPFGRFAKIPQSVKLFYKNLRVKGEGLAEASRLMLIGKDTGIKKAKFLTECTMALYVQICVGQKHAIINCDKSHERFYKQYGFETIKNSELSYSRALGAKPSQLIFLSLPLSASLSLTSIPKNKQKKFEDLSKELTETKQISRSI